jgi:hypothetical protein
MKKRTLGMIMFGLFALLLACGSDSGGDDKGTTGSSATGTPAGKFVCGKDTCELPADMPDAELCCMDPFKGGCGVKVGSSCREVPRTDSRCSVPSFATMGPPGAGGIMASGCCTPENECGIDFGAGCQTRTFLCPYIPKAQAAMLNPQTCDGTPLPLPGDCGQNGGAIPAAAGSGS